MKRARWGLTVGWFAYGSVAVIAHSEVPIASPDAMPTSIVGPVHKHDVPLNLNRTSWWLAEAADGADPGGVRLIFEAVTPKWDNLNAASDDSGAKLDLMVLSRGLTASGSAVSERVSIAVPAALAASAGRSGLTITVSGPARSFVAFVPAGEIVAFLARRDAAMSRAEPVNAAQAPNSADVKTVAADPVAPARRDAGAPHADPVVTAEAANSADEPKMVATGPVVPARPDAGAAPADPVIVAEIPKNIDSPKTAAPGPVAPARSGAGAAHAKPVAAAKAPRGASQAKAVAPDQTAAAKASVSSYLVDPSGAEFRNMHVAAVGRSGGKVCGEINPRSTTGKYGGFRRFVYFPAKKSSLIEDITSAKSNFDGPWGGC